MCIYKHNKKINIYDILRLEDLMFTYLKRNKKKSISSNVKYEIFNINHKCDIHISKR